MTKCCREMGFDIPCSNLEKKEVVDVLGILGERPCKHSSSINTGAYVYKDIEEDSDEKQC